MQWKILLLVLPFLDIYFSSCIYLLAEMTVRDKAGRHLMHHAVMGGSIYLVHYLRVVHDCVNVSSVIHKNGFVNACKFFLTQHLMNKLELQSIFIKYAM